MLDLNLIREKSTEVQAALAKRLFQVDFTELLAWDKERRSLLGKTEALKAQRNQVSSSIPQLKKEGKDTQCLMEEMKNVSDQIKELDTALNTLEKQIYNFLISLPNIPANDVIAGDKERNQIAHEWGSKPSFTFQPKDHIELVKILNLIDYERGTKLGGNGFWIYRGTGARLEWALINYFIEEHLKDGYEFFLPPHILTYQCGLTAGQFPKFEADVYHLKPENGENFEQFILPTSETALINIHRDEILTENELPKKYFAYTPCYRKEAGSYRASERGMIRGHQFNKVEMFQYTKPEDSEAAFQELVSKAERLVQGLGLHYRLSKLAAGDCSASMAKTYDIEIWIPSMNEYKEVSSASNAHDYQARRGNIRFKRKESGKNEFLHTLNASGLATSRLIPALVEQCQQADGSVLIPQALQKWFGAEIIQPE